MHRSHGSILCVLLAALVGFAPLLCCCGPARASVAEEVAVHERAAPDGCCTSEEVPLDDATGHDCDCDTHLNASATDDDAAVIASSQAGGSHLVLRPLPLPLAAMGSVKPWQELRHWATSDLAALPAAPTLRSLDVLLLT